LDLGIILKSGDEGGADCIEECVYNSLRPRYWFYSCGSCAGGTYDITLDLSLVPDSDHFYFTQSAIRLRNIVTAGLTPVPSEELLQAPDEGCSYPEIIDDVYICSQYIDIDGRNGTLAAAGPLYIRSQTNYLPITGGMIFDKADIAMVKATGYFGTIILHEMYVLR
jgi:hypothetical protein